MKKDGLSESPAPLTAFAYVRANTGSPEQNLDSVVEQLKIIDSFTRSWGIEIVRSFFDADFDREYSGPPELGSMVARATAGDRPVDYIIAASVRRIGRRRSALEWVNRRLREAGVELLCVSNFEGNVVPADWMAGLGIGEAK